MEVKSFRSFDGTVLDYVYLKGRNPVIVFVPAMGFDWTYWKRSLEYFSEKGHGVLALTLRGHSRARTQLRRISMEDHLKDLKSVLSELKIMHPVLVGASLGGAVAAAYKAENKKSVCICINTPFDSKRQLRSYIKVLVWLCTPIVRLDFFPRPTLPRLDFSSSRITNNIILILKGILKFNSYGIYLNYLCLKKSVPVKPTGCIVICSNKDEAVKITPKADYIIAGNHNCVISKSQQINALLERVINIRD
ncbi:MAG TPA: alpha/beta hydrolase [Candidatus Nanoarchaeia archaeon]|nr:alpha/beta hydrolase [Candidatus Nanoarchaeia archaeon]